MNKQLFLQRVKSDFSRYDVEPIVYTFRQTNTGDRLYYGVIVSNRNHHVLLFTTDENYSTIDDISSPYRGFGTFFFVEDWEKGDEKLQVEVIADRTEDNIIYSTVESILTGDCNSFFDDIYDYLNKMYKDHPDLYREPTALILKGELEILEDIYTHIVDVEYIVY